MSNCYQNLDAIDSAILQTLQQDASLTNVKLAEKIRQIEALVATGNEKENSIPNFDQQVDSASTLGPGKEPKIIISSLFHDKFLFSKFF